MDQEPDPLVEVARDTDESRVHEFGLVVLSLGAAYWVEEDDEGFHLLVEAEAADQARSQIGLYEKESAHWPPEVPEIPESDATSTAALLWLITMILCYGISSRWPVLFEMGKVSAEAIMAGEVYRTFTALFLHADIGHLAGNLFFGAVFLHLVARQTGTLLAWSTVMVAGVLGNYANVLIYYPAPHYSVGASTAVFGAVGVLVALPIGFRLRHTPQAFFRVWALPIIVGLIFLAWFGTGSERTDTSAHLMGFVSGLPLGVLSGFSRKREPED